VGDLDRYSSAELQAELRRRKERPPPVAFRCERCGAEGYYSGSFSQSNYEWQARRWRDQHAKCPSLYGGGGI
jgi:hypothetical protein